MKLAIGFIVSAIAGVIAVGVLTGSAPSIASQTSVATGSALANAGITAGTTSGLVYSNVNVFWALAVLLAVPALLFIGYKKGVFD